LQPEDQDTFNGVTYPAYRVSTSSASHPFFTGSKALVDAEGRVDKFKKRYAAAQAKKEPTEDQPEGQKEQGKKEAGKKVAKKKA
jgi:large subunit ribosomal protein L31